MFDSPQDMAGIIYFTKTVLNSNCYEGQNEEYSCTCIQSFDFFIVFQKIDYSWVWREAVSFSEKTMPSPCCSRGSTAILFMGKKGKSL